MTRGTVYVFVDDERKLVKIGWVVKDLGSAQREYERLAGARLRLVAHFEVEHEEARQVVEQIHQRLQDAHRIGGWFERTAEVDRWIETIQ